MEVLHVVVTVGGCFYNYLSEWVFCSQLYLFVEILLKAYFLTELHLPHSMLNFLLIYYYYFYLNMKK